MSRRVLAGLAGGLILSALPVAAGAQPLDAADLEAAPGWMRDLYAERGYAPVWSRGVVPSRAYDALLAAIGDADRRGLDPEAYGLSRLVRLRGAGVAEREQAASLAFASLVTDLIEGRTDPEIEYQPDFAPRREARTRRLVAAAYEAPLPTDVLAEVTPDNHVVERLTEALIRYRRIAERGGWDALPTDGVLIEAGETDPLVPAIRRRLAVEGYLVGTASGGEAADEAFVRAVERFQRSRSIADDGVVGPATLAAMNETPEALVRRLEVNIERARWLPSDLGERAAFVNVADYTLRLYEDGRQVDRMAVIVGTEETQTPVFADTMETVVVNPYWNVPSSILIGEIAPEQVADPTYVARKAFEVLRDGRVVDPATVDWRAAAAGSPSFRVRQTAGDHNALGRIKFLFPNKYAVYLHDTPADSLFERDVRTFSHGCIRVEDPVRFGAWLLSEPGEEVARMIRSEERVELETPPTPVYITYLTAWASPDGEVGFARDVYDRDEAVATRLGPTQG